MTGAANALEQLAQIGLGAGLVVLDAAEAGPVVLLGDVGEVEELVEGARHRQQVLLGQRTQVFDQFTAAFAVVLASALGQATNGLDLVDETIAQVVGDGAPQAIAEDADVVAQRFMQVVTHDALRDGDDGKSLF